MNKLLNISSKLENKIKGLDAKGVKNEYAAQISERIKKVVLSNGYLNFIIFTCSTINSEYLFSKKPWLYINLSPEGNNLEPDLPCLETILKKLGKIYPNIKITILIGNTDPYYIYLCQFEDFPQSERGFIWRQFSVRWQRYRKNFETWCKNNFSLSNLEILSWYEFEKKIEKQKKISFERVFERTLGNLLSYFNKEDIEWEFSQLRKQFGKGKYFEKLECPSGELLREWIIRKFAEYAVQGKWIYEQFPNSILIQNEKPSSLRSKMYQPLVKRQYKDVLPIVYFLGVNNEGYQ